MGDTQPVTEHPQPIEVLGWGTTVAFGDCVHLPPSLGQMGMDEHIVLFGQVNYAPVRFGRTGIGRVGTESGRDARVASLPLGDKGFGRVKRLAHARWVNDYLRRQYAPSSASLVAGRTPQPVNDNLRQQYSPAVSTTSHTPQWVNDYLRQQYSPTAASLLSSGTPQWVNDDLQRRYAPAK